ncbi:ornithine cyclodeaminase family protein [Stigmatella aurantiaca]|uniref:Ornithine cyclodeaminase n=1 Tax=Stigmatella aurantiaca (strain DW4/3-1) TaxID=378806 RepID=Q096R8_STIAD|nr:ornithine cyclodeaminase family protein [Stigmatella aurantiaca]ADO68556.1 Ornithine cyclodeaminase/mu-crystallin family protein [Stigmatella aurantiaca DW4/3-1]EAU67708.1 ornithine cyclodeaminase [Stigmatella aurantiaca DW4/3-1]
MSTLLLRRSDVVRNLQSLVLLSDMREAFRTDALARTVAPQRTRALLHAEGSTSVLFPGSLPGVPAYTVKVQARFSPQASGAQGVLQLHDLASGGLLALMDSVHLTNVRDGVLGALAADVLARPDARRVALLGAGPQAVLQLKSLRLVRTLSQAFVYDADPVLTAAFATRMYQELSLPVRMAGSVQEAVGEADIVVMLGGSRPGALLPEMLRPGTHLTLLSTEESGKGDLSPELLQRATFVCDHRGQAVSGGLGGAGIAEDAIHAELGEIIAGLRPGRTSPEQVTVFGGVGLPFQDLAAAWHVYLAAQGDEDVQRMDFGT